MNENRQASKSSHSKFQLKTTAYFSWQTKSEKYSLHSFSLCIQWSFYERFIQIKFGIKITFLVVKIYEFWQIHRYVIQDKSLTLKNFSCPFVGSIPTHYPLLLLTMFPVTFSFPEWNGINQTSDCSFHKMYNAFKIHWCYSMHQ